MELTSKQAAFVAEVVSGATLSDAYRAAYDADGMEPESVRVEACRLARHPIVALMIDEGRRDALDDAVWSRRRAIARLVTVNDIAFAAIQDGSHKPADVSAFMTSWDRLAKLHGLDRNTSDADQRWSDMISTLMDGFTVSL